MFSLFFINNVEQKLLPDDIDRKTFLTLSKNDYFCQQNRIFRMKQFKIHKEGRLLLLALVFLLFVFNVIIYLYTSNTWFAINLIVTALLLIFFAYFFRNPARELEVSDPNFVIAPADGTIVVVEPTVEDEYFHDERIQVSIFMSVFNVHANWYPIGGKIVKAFHQDGRHIGAWLPKSSKENERSTVVIETKDGTQILVRQIAGALARRVVMYAKEGKEAHNNEQMGFIKFGSRVDIFLPKETEVFVNIGEKTTGNSTVIARLNT